VRESLVPSLFVPMTGADEEARRVLPDGTAPGLNNGGFEEMLPESVVPTAWYYGRQMQVVEEADAPEGGRYLRLENLQPGRPSQLFQGFPVDGGKIGRVSFKLAVRTDGVVPASGVEDLPGLVVRFFNEQRTRSLNGRGGGWQADGPWRRVEGTVAVPAWAREAIVQIGMFGATGRFEVDDMQITGISR